MQLLFIGLALLALFCLFVALLGRVMRTPHLQSRPDTPKVLAPEAFRDLTLTILNERYPDEYVPQDDPLLIRQKDKFKITTCRLSNLYKQYLRVRPNSDHEIKSMITDHFDIGRAAGSALTPTQLSWIEASRLLKPQLVPNDFSSLDKYISRPLLEGIHIVIVLDFGNHLAYFDTKAMQRWGQTYETMYEIAISNLESATEGKHFAMTSGNDRFVMGEFGDFFGAVRILLPGMRERLSSILGDQYYYALPSREYFVCWSRDTSEAFQIKFLNLVKADYREDPYAISDQAFVAP